MTRHSVGGGDKSKTARTTGERAYDRVPDEGAPEHEISIFGRCMPKANLIKLIGLLAFFGIVVAVCVAVWPLVGQVFEEGGIERLTDDVKSAGPWGVLVILGFQLLQVIVAFIPGEVVQIAAGLLYGPWAGALIILVGCVISSFIIYQLVHRLGHPFVEAMVPTKYLDKFHTLEETGKLRTIVFILFLIPGMPKDTFTYLVPLTSMKTGEYLTVTTIARTPGVLMSTFAASGLANGDVKTTIIIVAVVAIIAGLAFLFRDKIMDLGSKRDR